MYIQSKMSHHDTQRRWQSYFQFSKRVFLGRRREKLSMLSSSLFFTLSGSWHGVVYARLRMCVCVHVCGRALVCMPVWLTHSAVNSVILGGPAVQGLHWHPTLVLNANKHTHAHNPAVKNTRHTLWSIPARTRTPAWLCYGSAFQFSAQLHSTVAYSKPRSLFSLRTHTHF